MELTKSEIITLTVILDNKIKEWAQLVQNFPAMQEHFDIKELQIIKTKINERTETILR